MLDFFIIYMMRTKELIAGIIFFIAGNFISVAVFAQSNLPDTLLRVLEKGKAEMKSIDGDPSLQKLSLQLPYMSFATKKITVSVYVKNNIPRKLLFNSYDESMILGGREMYYFDSLGKVIGYIHLMSGATIRDVYIGHAVIVDTKDKKNADPPQLIQYAMADYFFANAKYEIDYYLSNFKDLKYSTFDVTDNSGYTVKVEKATELRSSPNFNASVIRKLLKNAPLLYIDRSLQQDSVAGKGKWIWIKVRDKNKNEGWIWGHPSIIQPY